MTDTSLAVTAPSADDIAAIRETGGRAVALQRAITDTVKQIQGLQWGTVKGSGLSPETQRAFAQFCVVTKANVLVHINVLGGLPYLNASYWTDRINRDPFFIDYVQQSLSRHVEAALRARAEEIRLGVKDMPDSEGKSKWLLEAMERESEAADIAITREKWGAPEWAEEVVETTIVRFVTAAPMEKIRSGEMSWEEAKPYIRHVTECNWAGGRHTQQTGSTFRPDPVGDAFPALTARTRSLKRTACSAFSAWGADYEAAITEAGDALRRDFEVIEGSEVVPEALGGPSAPPVAPTALIGGGKEPAAGDGSPAQPIPKADVLFTIPPVPEPEPESETVDSPAVSLLKSELAAAGVEGKDAIHLWVRTHRLPSQPDDWTEEDFHKALELLRSPLRQKAATGALVLGLNLEEFAAEKGIPNPTTVEDFNRLTVLIDAAAEDGK